MNQEHFEVLKDCEEFMQSVNSALREQHANGSISCDTHKKVCDSFADVVVKLYTNQQLTNSDAVISFLLLNNAASEYRYRTGNYIDINLVLYKLGIEKLPDEIKFYLSCLPNQ